MLVIHVRRFHFRKEPHTHSTWRKVVRRPIKNYFRRWTLYALTVLPRGLLIVWRIILSLVL